MKWPTIRLDECARIVSGATPSTGTPAYWDGSINWATPKDLSDLKGTYIAETPRKITEAGLASCAAEVLPAGSILFSSRAPIGHVAINTVPMATNQGFKSFIPDPKRIHTNYLYWWLKANRRYLESLGNGATFKEVSKAVVSRVEIPFPPLDEQQRIAAILDHSDALRQKRRETMRKLRELRTSLFLTFFGDPSINPKDWPIKTIGSLADSTQYGTSAKAGETGELPILRMGNITYSGEMDFSDLKYITLSQKELEKYTVRDGDILFNRTNSPELVGKTAIFRGSEPYAFAGYLVRLRPNQEADPEYISAFLNSSYGKATLQGMCKSIIGMANINAKELCSIRIPVPPLALQQQFARRISELSAFSLLHHAHLQQLDALFASLQHRAFRGEL